MLKGRDKVREQAARIRSLILQGYDAIVIDAAPPGAFSRRRPSAPQANRVRLPPWVMASGRFSPSQMKERGWAPALPSTS